MFSFANDRKYNSYSLCVFYDCIVCYLCFVVAPFTKALSECKVLLLQLYFKQCNYCYLLCIVYGARDSVKDSKKRCKQHNNSIVYN